MVRTRGWLEDEVRNPNPGRISLIFVARVAEDERRLEKTTCNEDAFRVRGLLRHRCLLLALLVSVRPVLVPSIWCYAVLELTVVSRALIIRV